jgi:serine/threonine protein kinase
VLYVCLRSYYLRKHVNVSKVVSRVIVCFITYLCACRAHYCDTALMLTLPPLSTCNTPATLAWTAPERWRRGTLSSKSDVYSYGIVVWEVVAGNDGKRPWEGYRPDEVRAMVSNKQYTPHSSKLL